MRIIIEYMQLCHIHLYQKIARKKVARVNAALGVHVHLKYQLSRRVARNPQWGGGCLGVWGRSPQPLEANGGLGAKPPAAGGWGFGGKTPSRSDVR